MERQTTATKEKEEQRQEDQGARSDEPDKALLLKTFIESAKMRGTIFPDLKGSLQGVMQQVKGSQPDQPPKQEAPLDPKQGERIVERRVHHLGTKIDRNNFRFDKLQKHVFDMQEKCASLQKEQAEVLQNMQLHYLNCTGMRQTESLQNYRKPAAKRSPSESKGKKRNMPTQTMSWSRPCWRGRPEKWRRTSKPRRLLTPATGIRRDRTGAGRAETSSEQGWPTSGHQAQPGNGPGGVGGFISLPSEPLGLRRLGAYKTITLP